ncbi:transcription termination/antitermination protein NusG [Aggregatilineales bacterium SYSU G02658]
MVDDKRSKRFDRKGVDYDADPIYIDEQDDLNITLEETPTDDKKERAWYVVHCYSGYENKVKQSLEQRIGNLGMQDKIFDVIIPTEEEIEVKDGKRKTVEKRVFPGYILVDMIHDEASWFVVRNTPGVTGFVGFEKEPTPLSAEEVKRILDRMNDDRVQFKVNFKIGDRVRITSGPFNDFRGRVSHIDPDKGKVRVMVDFFGRETPVELDFTEVDKQ